MAPALRIRSTPEDACILRVVEGSEGREIRIDNSRFSRRSKQAKQSDNRCNENSYSGITGTMPGWMRFGLSS
jgi:hypothetical protein